MLTFYAEVRGLRRWLVPVPILTPKLSSYWVHFVTPIPASIAKPLIAGLRNEIIVRDGVARLLFPDIQLLDYRTAVKLALEKLHANKVETAWSVEKEPEIFSVEQLTALLSHAPEKLVPFLVLGAFAGLRTSEICKLDWAEVNLTTGLIQIKAAKTESARSRWIKMEPNLIGWLRPFAGRTGPVWHGDDSVFHHTVRPIWKAAGLPKWPTNGLRHSFASYHLAANQNQNQLADILGHANTKLIFSNYRNLVTPDLGPRYFSIFPPAPAENIVSIVA
jgi:integrase